MRTPRREQRVVHLQIQLWPTESWDGRCRAGTEHVTNGIKRWRAAILEQQHECCLDLRLAGGGGQMQNPHVLTICLGRLLLVQSVVDRAKGQVGEEFVAVAILRKGP